MSRLWLALCCFFPCRELIFTAYLIRHDFQPDMVFTVLRKHERRVSQDSFESWLFMPSPVTAPKISKGFLFIYNAVMILTTPFRSISSSGSVSCLSLHHCQHLYFCLSPLFRPFLSPACIVSSPLISVAFQLDAQMNMLHWPKHNLTPFVRYRIPSSMLLSHSLPLVLFWQEAKGRDSLIFPLPFFSKAGSLCV